MFDVIVIGCGIAGAAAAYELSKYRLSVAVLEKENDVACGATKANSAIIHAGYDPEPGTLMAKLNAEGTELAGQLFEQLDIPHRRCGSLVVAFSPEETAVLEELYGRGISNGVPGLELLGPEELRRLEPNLSKSAAGALLAKSAMIVSPWEYALALAETAVRNGTKLFLSSEVLGITRSADSWQVLTRSGTYCARYVVNAAGINADVIHNMAAAPDFTITPDRGEYYLLDKSEGQCVSHVIFQCPSLKGKGTLVSPTVHGNLIVGPNNETPRGRDDVAVTGDGLAEVASKARISVPDLNLRANIRNFSGIRAVADKPDFIIAEAPDAPGFIDIAGIKSPGLSAAPAIARYALEILRAAGLTLTEKESFIAARRRLRFAELDPREKTELVRKNPAYGQVVCRCETVTEGEIIDALNSPIPPVTLDGVKRRCNPGMGRCQGGFCSPRVLQLLAEHHRMDPTEILQDREGSVILTGETKDSPVLQEVLHAV
ncbi:NAD(P)/FAD-dependent oxidoreductase [Breznakiella homolactica]|uniref:NAD(P)/FAD-dependent oxidoreductase n=1 Tax=Breznakiella homolactica TaxID=2798577 RepID=A0A7T8B9L0_9SPIR|nr:NAD(P)/FAD-dependent oxidoreductase [Breznakiella homolactica]QQO08421.1 NAD(P)/FAD-dependent oxidoreductase [Breznakiella homolactica]